MQQMKNQPQKPRIRTLCSLAALFCTTSPIFAQECDAYQTSHLTPSELFFGPSYGSSVSMSGDTAIVGHRSDPIHGSFTGSVFIFKNIDGEWIEESKLLAPDGAQGDNFGSSISIDNDTIAIGAFSDDDNGQNTGSVYIYARDKQRADSWSLQTKLTLPDAIDLAHFGRTVVLDDDTLIVKSDGEANASAFVHVYTRTNGLWTQQTTLQLPDESTEKFSDGISIHAGTIAIRARPKDSQSPDSRSIYVYIRNEGVWALQARIEPSDTISNGIDRNGIRIHADTIVMGSSSDDDNASQNGAAYIFTRSNGEWTQHSKIFADDEPGHNTRFGSSVAIEGDIIAIGSGAPNEQQQNDGSLYIYKRKQSTWEPQQRIVRAWRQSATGFGKTIEISGDQIIAGAHGFDYDEDRVSNTAYIFDICTPICRADIIPDGAFDFFDVSFFLIAFNNQDPTADFNDDGLFNFFDISTFLQAFADGCP